MSRTLKLSTRLMAGFGALLLMLAAVIGMAAWQMRSLDQNIEAFANDIVPSLQEQNTIGLALSAMRRWQLRHVLADDVAEMDRAESQIAAEAERLFASIGRYEKTMIGDDMDRQHLEATRQAVRAYLKAWDELRPVSRRSATDPAAQAQAKAMMGDSLRTFDTAQKEVDDWWKSSVDLADRARTDSQATYASAKVWMFGLAAVAFAIGIGAAVLITRSTLRQLGGEPDYAKSVVGEIAAGNLTVHVALRDGDQDSLLAAMQGMRDRLREVVAQVRNSSDSIATGSVQIATGNADLSQRTEEQASNLQQTAASMEQLNGTVRTNADTTQQANELAARACATAVKGGETVGAVVATMQDIAAASRKISDIIGVIDGIAFQTNILALNAAVEAARAGEQGRGFAVVASEVRSLASRSAEAAREIKSLIGASVEKVEVGARQVDEAGSSMEEIVTQVQRVTQLISEITVATQEQTTGIGQVSDAVTQLDEVTQQNAALVEESAAAAESLRVQAAQLAAVVAMFQVNAESATPQAAAAPTTPPARDKRATPAAPRLQAAAATGRASNEWASF